jgi:putative addiction module antidote
MASTLRHITTIGNSLGITLPKELASAYGLEKGSLVTVRPTKEGLLLQPATVVSALTPEGTALAKDIVRRYRRAFDALAQEKRKVSGR